MMNQLTTKELLDLIERYEYEIVMLNDRVHYAIKRGTENSQNTWMRKTPYYGMNTDHDSLKRIFSWILENEEGA